MNYSSILKRKLRALAFGYYSRCIHCQLNSSIHHNNRQYHPFNRSEIKLSRYFRPGWNHCLYLSRHLQEIEEPARAGALVQETPQGPRHLLDSSSFYPWLAASFLLLIRWLLQAWRQHSRQEDGGSSQGNRYMLTESFPFYWENHGSFFGSLILQTSINILLVISRSLHPPQL